MSLSTLPAFADGAITVDLTPGIAKPGYGIGRGNTALDADRQALENCGAANPGKVHACKIMVRYPRCGAVAVSPSYHSGKGSGATSGGASGQALSQCGAGCSIVVADCVP